MISILYLEKFKNLVNKQYNQHSNELENTN